MGIYEGRGNLGKLMKDLENRWLDTRVYWDDEQAKRFQERFLEPMEKDLRAAMSAMDDMAGLLSQIRSECE